MKHAPYDLAQMQALPLDAKITMTKQRIKAWYEHFDGNVYVSVSGIDSTVLKHIIDGMYSDVPAVYVNTGLEYAEVQKFWREVKNGVYDCFNSDVEIIRPEMRFDEVIKTYGYPVISKEQAYNIEQGRKALKRGDNEKFERYVNGRRISPKTGEIYYYNGLSKTAKEIFYSDIPVSNKCCKIMKKDPCKKYEKETGRKPFVGTQAEESKLREQNWRKNGCNAFESNRPISAPLSFWTKQDILEYAKKYNVPFPAAYGEIIETGETINRIDGEHECLTTSGCKRTGCMFCMFGVHREKSPNRFEQMKITHPKQYDFCINKLECGKVLDKMGVKY